MTLPETEIPEESVRHIGVVEVERSLSIAARNDAIPVRSAAAPDPVKMVTFQVGCSP